MKHFTFIVTLLFSVTFFGCGERGAVISGTVKLPDGTPITSGEIAFSSGKQSFFGTVKADGNYVVGGGTEDKVPPGAYTIYLTGVNREEPDFATKKSRKILIVDPKYCSAATSDLIYTVQTVGPLTHNVTVPKPETAAEPKAALKPEK